VAYTILMGKKMSRLHLGGSRNGAAENPLSPSLTMADFLAFDRIALCPLETGLRMYPAEPRSQLEQSVPLSWFSAVT
jgi:hypothetical protein